TTAEIAEQVDQTGATVIVIATEELEPEELQRIASDLDDRPIELKVLPNIAESDYRRNDAEAPAVSGLRHRGFRDIALEDLIGRQPISTNLETISHEISDRVVLVTGAG
ncbi:hypothetical protein DN550_34480, partial [Burkholderia multivorans]